MLTTVGLGPVMAMLGDLDEAGVLAERGLALSREHALADLDRDEQARACWQRAITLLAELGSPHTVELRSLVDFA